LNAVQYIPYFMLALAAPLIVGVIIEGLYVI